MYATIPWYYLPQFRPARLQDCVLWLESDSFSGGIWHNLAPNYSNENHGTAYGGIGFSLWHPQFVSAPLFDGVDDYIDCGNSESLNISDAITAAAWVYIISFDTYAGIVDRRVSTYEWELRLNPASEKFEWRLNTSVTAATALADAVLGHWIFIAGTYDKNLSTGSTKLYLNGNLVHTVNAQGTLGYTEPINIGRGSGTQFLNAKVATSYIYKAALTPAEIMHNYTHHPLYYLQRGIDPFEAFAAARPAPATLV